MVRLILHIILFFTLFQLYQLNNIAYNIPDPDCTGVFNLCTDADKERLGRYAIKALHEQMDDDKDGKIEASESQDFIKEELESKQDSIRHRQFQNADLQITFQDLWLQWQNSAVYNWTTENVVDWLVHFVHLPQYADNFRRNQVDGRMIPRIATNDKHYLSAIMHIRDPRHKRRLIIKSTDVVLFGPPPRTHNLVKDMILISALLISIAACLYAFIRHRKTQESMSIMLKELETLQKAEGDLVSVTGKVKAMENELKDKTKVDRGLLNSWFVEVQQTKDEAEKYRKRRGSTVDNEKQLRLAIQEIEQLRIALRKAEEHAQHQSYEPPSELIDLLKRTYYMEETAFEIKRKLAEGALLTAKEQMIKISKMQRGFLGAVRIAHTGCMDDISELINAAKERLADVQDEYEERERRWNRISSLLDREDLISNSSSSTTSMGVNQYLPGIPNASLNSETVNNAPTAPRIRDSSNRSKQISIDSNESISPNKINNNIGIRGSTINPILSTQNTQNDTIYSTESSLDFSSVPSNVLRQRAMTNSAVFGSRSSAERLANSSTMFYSNSTNGLNDSNIDSTGTVQQNTYDSIHMPSLTKQTKPVFDFIPDLLFDNDSILDEQQQPYDRKSQTSDDRQSLSSLSDKTRKPLISTKLLKPFQNIHLRKKSNGGT